ncbi:MAG: SulP family inorganic anion transporter [Methanobacterium sp.]|nr:SulP family inorganic anion transporter [Methanobacterium sp.]
MNFNLKQNITSLLPIIRWGRSYDRNWLRPDIIAGITLGAFTIPEAVAYASLVGLPPEMGLYAAMIGLGVYLFFGTSRQLSMGPTADVSILVGATLGGLALASFTEYAALAAITAILTGIFALFSRILRMGFLVKLISKPVLKGFLIGVGFYIAVSQLPKLFGIHGASGGFFERIWFIIINFAHFNLPSFIIGVSGILFLLIVREKFKKVPGALILIIASIILMSVTNLASLGVSVLGKMSSQLPTFGVPNLATDISTVIPLAFACFLITYIEGMSLAKMFSKKHEYSIDSNQELVALGASNIAAGLGQGFPIGASMSRSLENDEINAKTPLSGAFSAVTIAIVILFLSGLLFNLPQTILASIVLVAIIGLFDISGLIRIYHLSKREFAIALITLFSVLVFGILQGIIIGVILSFIDLIERIYNPKIAILGQISNSNKFGDIERHPENKQLPGILVIRVDGCQIFASAEKIKESIIKVVRSQKNPVKLLILDFKSSPIIDVTGAEQLEELCEEMDDKGINVKLAHVSGQSRDFMRSAGLEKYFGILKADTHIHDIIDEFRPLY